MQVRLEAAVALACVIIATNAAHGQARSNNVILFVPDGLRALQVTPELAPAMAAIRDRGVAFKNPEVEVTTKMASP